MVSLMIIKTVPIAFQFPRFPIAGSTFENYVAIFLRQTHDQRFF